MNDEVYIAVDNYIIDLLAKEDKVLKDTLQSIEDNSIPFISISATQGKFLQVMAKAVNAKKILELGTLAGYSTIWLARILPDDGKIISIESDLKHAEVAKENIRKANLSSKVEIKIGQALDILPALKEENVGPFDMIFIDADKPPYTEYFQWAIQLGRPGTIIVVDNVVRNGDILDSNSKDEKVKGVQRFNKMLSLCTEVTATILQTVGIKEYDGMAIAVIN